MAGTQATGVYRYKIGSYELTAIYDGTWYRKIDDKFVRNAAWPEVQKALADHFLPADTCADLVHDAAGQHRLASSS